MSDKDGGSAFPKNGWMESGVMDEDYPDDPSKAGNMWHEPHAGITVRDYFAAAALQGLCVNHSEAFFKTTGSDEHPQNTVSRLAYSYADAMLKERNK